MLASVGHWWEGRWSGGLHPPSTCLWGVHLPPSPASPSPTPPEASFRAAAAAGESVTAQTQGSPLSCRNASQSPSRLKAHYYKEWNTFFFFSLSLSFSFGWHGESVIKILCHFVGWWWSWWWQCWWGRIAASLYGILVSSLTWMRKPHQPHQPH